MKLTEFNQRKTELGIEGTGIDSTILNTMTWTNKETGQVDFQLTTGNKVHVWFSPKVTPNRAWIQFGDEVKRTSLGARTSKYLSGIKKEPSMKTLEKYSDCISKSVTGKTVEPDGYSYDGSPSWLLVLGLI